MTKLAIALAALLTSCAPVQLGQSYEEVVEGNVESYPAFENAARMCAFTKFKRVNSDQEGGHYLVRFSDPPSNAYRCLIHWLAEHPELGLDRAGH